MTARGKWALLALGVAVLVGISMPGTLTTLRNGSVASMTLAEYAAGGSGAEWLELKDCWIIPEQVVGTYEDRRYRIRTKYDDIYAPLGTSPDDPGPYRVVMLVRDRHLWDRLERHLPRTGLEGILGGRFDTEPGGIEAVHISHVRGTVPYGILSLFNAADRSLIEHEAEVPLAADWVILEQHAEPGMPVEGLLLALAAIALAAGWFWIPASERARLAKIEVARRREERLRAAARELDDPSPPPPPPAPPPPPPVPPPPPREPSA